MSKLRRQIPLMVVLIALVVLTLIPIYVTVISSQKTNAEIFTRFWQLPSRLRPEYFIESAHYLRHYIVNSLLVALGGVAGVLALSSLTGYAFARIRFTAKSTLFVMILALMMIPGILTLIPAFNWIRGFPFAQGNNWLGEGGRGLLDSWFALWLPYIAGGQIFGILLCRSYLAELPEDLFEAARIDGANEWRIYRSIALPLMLPILAALAIMQFIGLYNDYIWPLVTISSTSKQVFAVGVTRFAAEGNLTMGPVMAGYIVGAIPLILAFCFGMKYYVQGLTSGAIKA